MQTEWSWSVSLVWCVCASFLLWSKTHAQAGQVSVTEGEEDHEDDEPAVMLEENWQVDTRLNVAQHEEGHKDHTTRNDHRK